VATLTVLTTSVYEDVILADRPTSFWPLNETSGTLIHDVVGSNNGTCMNTSGLTLNSPGILYDQGVTQDTAIYFNSTNDGYISVSYSAKLNTPKFTVEAWLNMPVFPVAGAGVNMFPLSMDDAPAPNGWGFHIASPNAANPPFEGWVANSAGSGWTAVGTGTCIQGAWAYYAMTYDGTTFSVYTNGVFAASKTTAYAQVGVNHPLYIGAYYDSGTADRFFQGSIAKVAVYSNALSPGQILNHYQVGATGIPNAPAMAIQRSGSNIIVNWTTGFLQQASSLNGSWVYNTNAVSPYSLAATNPALFFRATIQPPQ
jgi:trimeric autotransporter adhesin